MGVIKIEDVTYAYRDGFDALKGVTCEFGPGIHLLLGPNGAGKTTLLRVMAGLLRPQAGECMIGKEAMAYHSPHAVKEIFMLTDECLFPLDTINDMARRHAPFYPRFSAEALAEALKTFGMTGDERLKDLSLGNRHKAQAAYALSLGTQFLLLDEPANGLDIASKRALTELIARAVDDERCIIVATHTVQEMRNLFDSVTILKGGRVALSASTALIMERLAFIGGPQRPDALCYQPAVDGPCQIVAADGSTETPIDFILLYLTAVGDNADRLKRLLKNRC